MTTPKQRMGSGALDWRDFVTGLGSGDDAVAIAKAFGKVQENTPTLNPGLDVQLASPLRLTNRAGLRLATGCEPRPNGGGASPVFRWAGPTGGDMLVFDEMLFAELSGWTVQLDAHDGKGPSANRGLVLDGFQGPQVPGEPYYGFGTQSLIERVVFLLNWDNPDAVALDISPTVVQNQEYHHIRKSQFSGGNPKPAGMRAAARGVFARTRPLATSAIRQLIRSGAVTHTQRVGTAIRVGPSANAKAECVEGTDFSRWGVAIDQRGGSMHIGAGECCYFTDNEIDYQRTGASEASFIRANTEASRQFLVDRMGYGMTILEGTRLHNGWQRAEAAYIVAGALLHIDGVIVLDSRAPKDGKIFDLSNCQIFTGGPIHFAAGTPFSETGLDTMPHSPERYMDVLIYNVVDDKTGQPIPRRLVQGRQRLRAYGEGKWEAFDVELSSSGENIDAAFARIRQVQAPNAAGGGRFAGTVTTYEQQGGGAPQSVDPARLDP